MDEKPSRRSFSAALAAAAGIGALGKSVEAEAGKRTFEIEKTEAEWRALLTPEQFYVLREHGTERAFTSPLDKLYEAGTYHCAGCDLALFESETKYDSGTGWPSFWQPIEGAIGTSVDYVLFYPRTEVHCRRCGGHLGHVFNDGPRPTGLRYCMNGIAMTFKPREQKSG
ncbi:MAG: peptide-methionine (R)-S-oxide reductase MsrB [Hyphomicrobiaceae bacterium]